MPTSSSRRDLIISKGTFHVAQILASSSPHAFCAMLSALKDGDIKSDETIKSGEPVTEVSRSDTLQGHARALYRARAGERRGDDAIRHSE